MFDVAIVGGGPGGSELRRFLRERGPANALVGAGNFSARKSLRRLFEPGVLANSAPAPISGTRSEICRMACSIASNSLALAAEPLAVTLPAGDEAEIAIKRSLFDQLIMKRARELGATICEGSTVTALTRPDAGTRNWTITAADRTFESRIAGRCRWSELDRRPALQPASTQREGAHRVANSPAVAKRLRKSRRSPIPAGRIFRPGPSRRRRTESLPGQCSAQDGGFAQLGGSAFRNFAATFVANDHSADTRADHRRCSRISFSRRRRGAGGGAVYRAKEFITRLLRASSPRTRSFLNTTDGIEAEVAADYSAAHAKLYRGRLWINRLARAAVLSPRVASVLLEAARFQPALLRLLTAKIVRDLAWLEGSFKERRFPNRLLFSGRRFGNRRSLGRQTTLHLPASLDRIRHQHRDRHRTHSSGHRRNRGSFLRDFVKRDIAHQPITALRGRVVDAIDSHVDHDSAVAHVFRSNKFRLPNRRDQDVGRTRDLCQTLAAGMDHRTVASPPRPFRINKSASGFPTIMLRPRITTCAPEISIPLSMSKR